VCRSSHRCITVLIRSIRSSRVTRALAKRKIWPRHASQSPFGGRFAPLLFLVTRHRGWRIDRIDTVIESRAFPVQVCDARINEDFVIYISRASSASGTTAAIRRGLRPSRLLNEPTTNVLILAYWKLYTARKERITQGSNRQCRPDVPLLQTSRLCLHHHPKMHLSSPH